MRESGAEPYTVTSADDRLEISADRTYPPLRFKIYGLRATFALDGGRLENVYYRTEAERGYASVGELWSPGYFSVDVTSETAATLVGSTDSWETIRALVPEDGEAAEHERRKRLLAAAAPAAREGIGAELALAADQFVITPLNRQEDAARARAAGEEVRSVIAGYHWFTDWGRDTMISLEGLTCATGRHREAGWILRTFGQYIRNGLIPNMFPDGSNEGLYHTADATLWFFHALDRYLRRTDDRVTLEVLLPKLADVVARHLEGTLFGIHVDPADGLLVQGADGYALTWMDAKCDGWVVTPRRGKAVEINALWYNALRLLEGWTRDASGPEAARPIAEHAEQCRRSFNERFWYADGGHLYDVVESADRGGHDDPACRPNQIFAISLEHPVLDESRWKPVLDVVREKLLDAARPALALAGSPGLQGELPRRPADAGLRVPPGHGVGLADRARSSTRGSRCIPTTAWGRGGSSRDSCPIWTRRASARSARCSTPWSRSRPAAASPRRGAWPKSCAPGSPPAEPGDRAPRRPMRLARSSGILLHPTSLPGRFGIGDLGPEAYRFVDFLAAADQAFWQIMPLGPSGLGDSPYSSHSAFAGNPNLISPEDLVAAGLLAESDLSDAPVFPEERVDYGKVIGYKRRLLEKAFRAFVARLGRDAAQRRAYADALAPAASWLDDYALFSALHDEHGGAGWQSWGASLARREPRAMEAARLALRDRVEAHRFFQYLFADQWQRLKAYANRRGVRIIGDIPIFVAHNSADVWARPDLFQLDAHGSPTVVSGVPPDAFSATGQLWGNPLYDWTRMRADGFRWWIDRVRRALGLVDVVRLDHFRGFAACWEVAASEDNRRARALGPVPRPRAVPGGRGRPRRPPDHRRGPRHDHAGRPPAARCARAARDARAAVRLRRGSARHPPATRVPAQLRGLHGHPRQRHRGGVVRARSARTPRRASAASAWRVCATWAPTAPRSTGTSSARWRCPLPTWRWCRSRTFSGSDPRRE